MWNVGRVALGFAIILGMAPLAVPFSARAAESSDAALRQTIEGIIRDYLSEHPEVVLEALQKIRRREQEAQQKRTAEAVRAHLAELTQDLTSPVGGNPKGTATIVEFFDYQCPHCKREAVELTKLLQTDPDIRLIYKELPILGPMSVFAAQAALAAGKQGKYEAMHRALMAASDPLTEQSILRLAAQFGLDIARLETDMKDPAVAEAIERTRQLAQLLGIRGTPALVVGSEYVPGAVDLATLKDLVAQARGK